MDLSTAQLDRARGVLLATAAGDALGAGYEFGPPLAAHTPVHLKGGGSFGWAPGEWTDDTSMALAIAGTAAAGADLRTAFAQDEITRRWAGWAKAAPDVGIQTRRILSSVRNGTAAEALAESQALHEQTGRTAGNGSLMRTAPVALAYLDDPAALTEAATALSRITHYDPEAAEACVLWCHAIRHAVLTGELSARAGLGPLPTGSRERWSERLEKAERANPADFANNGWVVEALQAAWCAIATTPVPEDDPAAATFRADHLRLALENAVRGGRDTDTVAAIAGGLLGGAYGASAVPASWRLKLQGWPGIKCRDLAVLADAIAVGRGRSRLVYGGDDRAAALVPHPDDPGLLLGDIAVLRELPPEVSAVVSLCPAAEREEAAILDRVPLWLEVPLADTDDPAENPNLDFVLHDTVTAVEELRAAGRVVLVHCVAAYSRTPTIGALYSMRRTGTSPDDAIAALDQLLPEADPTDAFRAALDRARA